MRAFVEAARYFTSPCGISAMGLLMAAARSCIDQAAPAVEPDVEQDDEDLGVAPGPWTTRGLCRNPQVDPADFYPEGLGKGTDAYKDAKRRAKATCALCPVSDSCLSYAIGTNIQHGIWGGKTVAERRSIKYPRQKVS